MTFLGGWKCAETYQDPTPRHNAVKNATNAMVCNVHPTLLSFYYVTPGSQHLPSCQTQRGTREWAVMPLVCFFIIIILIQSTIFADTILYSPDLFSSCRIPAFKVRRRGFTVIEHLLFSTRRTHFDVAGRGKPALSAQIRDDTVLQLE